MLRTNCRMPQEPASDRVAIAALRDAVRERRHVSVELLKAPPALEVAGSTAELQV